MPRSVHSFGVSYGTDTKQENRCADDLVRGNSIVIALQEILSSEFLAPDL